MRICAAIAFSVLVIAAPPVWTQEDFFAAIDTQSKEDSSEKSWQHKAFIQQKLKYGLQVPNASHGFERGQKGITQLQTDLFAELSGELNKAISYRLGFKGELEYLEWQADEREWQLNHEELLLKNAFADIVFENGHWLRIGQQMFAWGESESLSITDVLAPYDLREFAQTELRDIREPIPAVLYSFPVNDHKFSIVASWQARAHRYADQGEAFYPYASFDNLGLTVRETNPEKEWELALRYERFLNGSDFSIVAAEVNDNEMHFILPPPSSSIVNFKQARVKVLAFAINKVIDSWQLKGEFGLHKDKARNFADGGIALEDQWRGMLGLEFSGMNDWQFSYELNAVKVRNSTQATFEADESPGHVLRVQHTAWNERLTQQLWWMDLINDDGQVFRWDLSYDWSDHWAFTAGVVIYRNSNDESVFFPFRNNDSSNLSVTYHF